MDYQTLILTYPRADILQIQLSRPDKLNALNALVFEELEQTILYVKQSAEIKGVIITGEGKAFCAGADIRRLLTVDAEEGFILATEGQRVFRQLEKLGKPSIAAVNGLALGGGCELAIAATLRIASESAAFGQPEVKLGLLPGYGGTQRLARLVGKGRALEACMTGLLLDAPTALQWGLISAVTPIHDLLPTAVAQLSLILGMGPAAIREVMAVIDEGYDLPLDEALAVEARAFSVLCGTQDKKEGIEAFLEKRQPLFSGK